MKNLSFILLIALVGCAKQETITTADGTTIQTDSKGGMTMSTPGGDKMKIEANDAGSVISKNDGTQVKVTQGGTTVTNAKGEVASMGAETVTEEELGLPFYPGSAAVSGQDVKSNLDGKKTFMSVRSTSDSPEKVATYYKEKLEGGVEMSSKDRAVVSGKLKDGRTAGVTVGQVDGKSEITVTVNDAS